MITNPSMTRFRFFCLLADNGNKHLTIDAMIRKFGPALNYADAKQIVTNNQNHLLAYPIGRGQFEYELKNPHQYRHAWR